MEKWYKVKVRNSRAFSDAIFMNVDVSESYFAKGPKDLCEAVKVRLEQFKYPGDLYIEDCDNDGKEYPHKSKWSIFAPLTK